MDLSIPTQLPNQTQTTNTSAYSVEAVLRYEMQQAINAAAKQAANTFKMQHPAAKELRAKTATNVYKSKPGFGAVVPNIIKYMVIKDRALLTQRAILDVVRQQLPQQIIHDNVWQQKLKRKQITAAKEIISGSDNHALRIDGCKTLSCIRKRLQAHLHGKEAEFKTTINVKISRNGIVINNKAYPLIINSAGKSKYPIIKTTTKQGKQASIRLDALISLV